jgi:hypothetical protein
MKISGGLPLRLRRLRAWAGTLSAEDPGDTIRTLAYG